MCLPFPKLESRRLDKGEHLGFQWEIVSNTHGYRCGYVRVLPGHPWFEKDLTLWDDEMQSIAPQVHGGVTFAKNGKPCPTHDELAEWWIGFDCAHAQDQIDLTLIDDPELKAIYEENRDVMLDPFVKHGYTIKDNEYVKAECFSLIEQARRAGFAPEFDTATS